MKKIMHRKEWIKFYERDEMIALFEKRAKEGWLISKIGAFLWTYTRIEPADLYFSIIYSPNVSDYDTTPTKSQIEQAEYCQIDGWKQTACFKSMQVFYNEEAHPKAIETDPIVQFKTISNTMKKSMKYLILQSLLLLVIQLIGMSEFISDPVRYFVSSYVYTGMIIFALFLYNLSNILLYIFWHIKGKRQIEQGNFPKMKQNKAHKWVCTLISVFVMSVVLIGIYDDLTYKNARLFDNKDPEVFPFKLEDICDVLDTTWTYDFYSDESLFLKDTHYFQTTVNENDDSKYLIYETIETKNPLVYKICKKGILRELKKQKKDVTFFSENTKESQFFGANEVYKYISQEEKNKVHYMICYRNQILQIAFEEELDEVQKETVKNSFRE